MCVLSAGECSSYMTSFARSAVVLAPLQHCNVEVRRLELEHLSLKFGDQSEPTTLMQQVGLFGACTLVVL